jgi:hypothetical protein
VPTHGTLITYQHIDNTICKPTLTYILNLQAPLQGLGGWKHTTRGNFGKKMYSIFCIFIFFHFILVFWKTLEMNFGHKAYNTILLSFKRKFFKLMLSFKMKNLFVVKSHEWNFSYGIEVIQLIHMQCTAKHLNKLDNHSNNVWNIFALSILLRVSHFHKYIFLIIY